MTDFQGRRRWRSVWYSRPVAVVLVLAALLLGHSVFSVYWRHRAVAVSRAQAEAELASLRAQQATLEREISELKTDAGIAAEIRKKFPVVSEGEKVIVVVPEEASGTTTTTPQESDGWWQAVKKVW
jgi:cell division protein FtsB